MRAGTGTLPTCPKRGCVVGAVVEAVVDTLRNRWLAATKLLLAPGMRTMRMDVLEPTGLLEPTTRWRSGRVGLVTSRRSGARPRRDAAAVWLTAADQRGLCTGRALCGLARGGEGALRE